VFNEDTIVLIISVVKDLAITITIIDFIVTNSTDSSINYL